MFAEPDRRLVAFAAAHHGLFRRADALTAGLTRHQIRSRLDSGRFELVARGLYRMAGTPGTVDQQVLAAVWRSGGVASHRTAAWLHGIRERPPARPEVTVDRGSAHEFDGFLAHRSGDLDPTRVRLVRDLPVTSVPRTLVDLGQVVSRVELDRSVHRALHRGLVRLDHLVDEYRSLSKPGRRGCGPMGELLGRLAPDRAPVESELEFRILHLIRSAGLPEPVAQYVVVLDRVEYRLDFAYPEHRVFLEGDGFGVHGGREAFERDRVRQNRLILAGWRVLRFTWRQTIESPESVVAQVATILGIRGS